jgi:hypothetical protein
MEDGATESAGLASSRPAGWQKQNLFDDIAHVDRRRGRSAFFDLAAQRPQIVGRDLGHKPVFPRRCNIAVVDVPRISRVDCAILASLK